MPPDEPDLDPLQTSAARILRAHRDCLRRLLARADAADPAQSAQVGHAVSLLVEQLAQDLIRLYAHADRGLLTETDLVVVLPALERLRNSLRFWQHRRRTLRDTIHRAIETIGDFRM